MTKQQEVDIAKYVNTNLRWTIGVVITCVIFLIGFKINEVKSDSTFKGEIKNEIKNINEKIDDLKSENKEKATEKTVISISKSLNDTKEDMKSVQFFLKAKFDYAPIERSGI